MILGIGGALFSWNHSSDINVTPTFNPTAPPQISPNPIPSQSPELWEFFPSDESMVTQSLEDIADIFIFAGELKLQISDAEKIKQLYTYLTSVPTYARKMPENSDHFFSPHWGVQIYFADGRRDDISIYNESGIAVKFFGEHGQLRIENHHLAKLFSMELFRQYFSAELEMLRQPLDNIKYISIQSIHYSDDKIELQITDRDDIAKIYRAISEIEPHIDLFPNDFGYHPDFLFLLNVVYADDQYDHFFADTWWDFLQRYVGANSCENAIGTLGGHNSDLAEIILPLLA